MAAKKVIKKEQYSVKHTELLAGISFFVAGIMLWMSSIGLIDSKVVWANILMVVGMIFVAKEVYYSFTH